MLDLLEFDDAQLEVMLDRAKQRSRVLGRRRRLYHRVAGAAAAVLVVGTAGVYTLQPSNGGGAPRQAGRTGTHQVVAPSWRLVGDVTQPTWQEQPPLGEPGRGYGLVCPAAATCYLQEAATTEAGAAESVVEVTHDGGSTWQQASMPAGDLASTGLSCVDADHCVAGGIDGSSSDVLITTSDGGQTWTSLSGPAQLGSSFQLLTVSCVTASSCTAMGLEPGSGNSADSYYSLVTGDGGQTWSDSALPAGFVPVEVRCVDTGGNCLAVGIEAAGGGATSSQGMALSSTDGGQTWTVATVPSGAGPITAVSCSDDADCTAVSFVSPGGSSQVLVTTDGGQSWSLASGSGLGDSLLQAIACPTSSYCWAAGIQLPPASDGSPQSVPISQSEVTGALASTTDGGQSWDIAALPTDLTNGSVVTGVACPTSTTCLATVWQSLTSAQQGRYVLLEYSPGS